jgi:hypothetical protein
MKSIFFILAVLLVWTAYALAATSATSIPGITTGLAAAS